MFKVIESPTKCEIRSVIRFLTVRNMSAAHMHSHVTEVDSTEAIRDSKVRKWAKMNQTCFQNVEEWSETNITGNSNFQWYFLTLSHVNWADIENYVEFLTKEIPDIKIEDNCLFEVERRLNVYLNSNKLEQLENPHAEKLLKYG
ncbi:hypothetical protein TNCV_946501 [Trichonephila clavipes]|nr:hypothetical protein TNCV_946501 [Trichonephila clavipes]